jgi:hypothetical protein
VVEERNRLIEKPNQHLAVGGFRRARSDGGPPSPTQRRRANAPSSRSERVP